jgi:hypothetical protein
MRSGAIAAMAALAVLAAAAGSAGVRAEEQVKPQYAQFAKRMFADRLVEKGVSYACFKRKYGAAHLAKHPQQKVKFMTLVVRAEVVAEDPDLNYSFQFDVGFRDRKGDFNSSGSCGHAAITPDMTNALHLGCGVDCDGGGLSIALADSDKAILVRLDSIAIWDASKPDAERTDFEAGADDHVFLLDRVKNDVCKKMIESYDDKPATM